MKLVQVKGNTWYLEGAELIPVYRLDEHKCILLDSGWYWEREALREALEREGLHPVGIIGSHTHPDHSGNHTWLKKTYGASVCMSAGEAARGGMLGMCKTMYHSLSLGGVLERIGKDFLFETDVILGREDGEVEFMDVPFRIHHTPGHTPDHICIGTPDGVCYLGDMLMSERVVQAAQMPYHEIQSMAKEAMEKMRNVEGYSHFVVAHKGVLQDLPAAIDENLGRMEWVCQRFLEVLEKPLTWSQIIEQILERNNLTADSEMRITGYENIVQSYVDALKDDGRIGIVVEKGVRRFYSL